MHPNEHVLNDVVYVGRPTHPPCHVRAEPRFELAPRAAGLGRDHDQHLTFLNLGIFCASNEDGLRQKRTQAIGYETSD